MAATVAAMAVLNAKSLSVINPPKNKLSTTKPTSNAALLPKGLSLETANNQLSAGSALAGAIFATMVASEPAVAAQQIAEIAEGDNRGLALLLPIIPAIAWVLFNILQPALNQINRMRSTKGVIVGLGLGGLGGLVVAERAHAAASEIASIAADAPPSDNRGQLLLFVIAPALLWVLYNILQPALNQLNRMRNG